MRVAPDSTDDPVKVSVELKSETGPGTTAMEGFTLVTADALIVAPKLRAVPEAKPVKVA